MADLVIDALAVWRIVRLLQRDSITEAPREWFVNRYGTTRGGIAWSDLADCPWCLSIWVAAGVVLARRLAPRVWGTIARGLAFSAGAGVITGLVDQLDD